MIKKMKLSDSKKTTTYDEFTKSRVAFKVSKELACAILASALDDADFEFFAEDYDEWKKYRLKRKKKSENLNELDLKKEFTYIKNYKEVIFEIAEVRVNSENIPEKAIEDRMMFEDNKITTLKKLTNYNETTLVNISKLHGWKIGINYKEPTIFDL